MSSRQEYITNIIQQRKPLAIKVGEAREKLMQASGHFDAFRSHCNSIISGNEELSQDFAPLLRIMDDAGNLITEANLLSEDLMNIQTRLSRDTLNIAVIGMARQGKSRLLQTITGLGSEEIPDGNLQWCTGVRSDIINDPSVEKTYAQVNFLTDKKFLANYVAPYFTKLQAYRPDIFTPLSINEFRAMTIPGPETFNAEYQDRPILELHIKHLKDLQEHLPQYQEYLGRPTAKIERKEIRQYVAQDNEKGERVYFKHMAVDSVEIFCKFPNSDVGALRLIDLPGLGDTRIGDVERVVSALSDQVDLVFFLLKPGNTGAGWGEKEINLYSEARRALGDKLPIERWSFWVFNHDSRPGADNMLQCESLKSSMSASQIVVSDSVIIDGTNPEEVSSGLIDKALSFLSNNIERNDREYTGNIQGMTAGLMERIRVKLNEAEKCLKDTDSSHIDSSKFDDLFDALWDELQAGIEGIVRNGSGFRNSRDVPCEPFRDRINAIIDDEEKGDIRDRILGYIRRTVSTRNRGLTAFEDAMQILRTSLSHRMQEDLDDILNDVLNDMKDSISLVLAEQGRLKSCFNLLFDHLEGLL